MKKNLLLLCLFLMTAQMGHARKFNPSELQFSVFNEAISLPTKSPVWSTDIYHHFGMGLGFNWEYRKGAKSSMLWNLSTQYYNHQFLYSALQIYGAWDYRYHLSPSFALGFESGMGYMHRFSHMPEYRFDDDGYQRIRRLGIPSLIFTLGTQLHWYPKSFLRGASFFLKYQIQGVYHFAGVVPVVPSTMTHLGITFPFSSLFQTPTP